MGVAWGEEENVRWKLSGGGGGTLTEEHFLCLRTP